MSNDIIDRAQATLSIDLKDTNLAEIIYSAIKPETESVPSDRAITQLVRNEKHLIITINELISCLDFRKS